MDYCARLISRVSQPLLCPRLLCLLSRWPLAAPRLPRASDPECSPAGGAVWVAQVTNSAAQLLGHAGGSTDLAHQSFDLVNELQALLFVLFALSVLLLKQPSTFGGLPRTRQNLRKRSKLVGLGLGAIKPTSSAISCSISARSCCQRFRSSSIWSSSACATSRADRQ